MIKNTLILLGLLLLSVTTRADKKHITGKCYDNETKEALEGVIIYNIYTDDITTSDSLGRFSLDMEDEELIEFRMLGYNTARIRMRSFLDAKFYNIGLTRSPEPIHIQEQKGFYYDSLRLARYYAKELGFDKMSTAEIINNPIEYFSKTNQKKWKFQDEFDKYIANAYIEEYFNPDYVKSISPLRGKDLNNFLIFYRPNYEFVRSMSRYDFLLWIKGASNLYYERQRYNQIQHE